MSLSTLTDTQLRCPCGWQDRPSRALVHLAKNPVYLTWGAAVGWDVKCPRCGSASYRMTLVEP